MFRSGGNSASSRFPLYVCLIILSLGLFSKNSAAQDWTDWMGPQASTRVRARLRDEDQNARDHIAVVEVEVLNVWLDTPQVVEQPGIEVGVLRYQVDRCPPVVTTATRLQFHQLKPGAHTITVAVIGADDRPITPPALLKLTVP